MKIILSQAQKERLEKDHRKEKNRKVADRIKAVLLSSEGWKQINIAQALRIRQETVSDHLKDYLDFEKVKNESGGSKSKLTSNQTNEIINHLEKNTYSKVCDICEFIKKKYNIEYTESGLTKWLHKHGFTYKKPKGTPLKADPEKQKEFIKYYKNLIKTLPENEPLEFGDGVHPTMATKISYGWIRKGKDKPIATIASRTRSNIMGSINLKSMDLSYEEYKTINCESMENYFKKLGKKYKKAPQIHLILDQGPYNKSKYTKEAASKYKIKLYYLPPYSPNLNPIERVWKIMNEKARNNKFFNSAQEFRESINNFFKITWPKIACNMRTRINDNFQTLEK